MQASEIAILQMQTELERLRKVSERRRAYSRLYYKKNRARLLKYRAKYAERHPSYYVDANRKHRHKLRRLALATEKIMLLRAANLLTVGSVIDVLDEINR